MRNLLKILIEIVAAALATTIVLVGCEEKQENSGPKYDAPPQELSLQAYRFAVHPLHNPMKLSRDYQPLLDYLNKNIPDARFILEASRDYPDYELKIRRGRLEFLLPNPWQTLEAMKSGYEVIATAGAAEDFKGIFIVRKDSGIKKPADLKGKVVSYPAATALAACVMPQYFLHVNGLNVNTDIENRYVGSQESSIMNAFLKQSAAAATWPPPWRAFQKEHPQEAEELMVIWETPSLINNSVMVRKDIPSDLKKRVRKLLVELQSSQEGEEILEGMETAGFYEADDAGYDLVRRYVDCFENEVRKVSGK